MTPWICKTHLRSPAGFKKHQSFEYLDWAELFINMVSYPSSNTLMKETFFFFSILSCLELNPKPCTHQASTPVPSHVQQWEAEAIHMGVGEPQRLNSHLGLPHCYSTEHSSERSSLCVGLLSQRKRPAKVLGGQVTWRLPASSGTTGAQVS
jgi:hypothetical protein